MKFMMFVATDPQPDARRESPDEIGEWFAAVNAGGHWLAGDRLRPAADAKTIRVRSGTLHVAAGPYTQASETIVGFDVLECESLEQAVEIAAKHPMARCGRIELRQIWPHEEQ